jgi:hypothetical protein
MSRIRRLHSIPSCLALLAACGIATAAESAPLDGFAALRRDDSRIDPLALEQASRVALRDSISALAPERAVEVDVVDLRAVPDSVDALAVEGVGRVRVADGHWIPLRFNAGYDAVGTQLFGLRVQPLPRASRASTVSADLGLHDRVAGQVAARIVSEFAEQPVDVVIMDVQAVTDQTGYVALRGTGSIDFAEEGIAPVAFSAILDRGSGLVIATDYTIEVLGAHGAGVAAGTLAAR